MKFRLAGLALGLGLVGVICGAKLGDRWSLFGDARVVQIGTNPKQYAFELL